MMSYMLYVSLDKDDLVKYPLTADYKIKEPSQNFWLKKFLQIVFRISASFP